MTNIKSLAAQAQSNLSRAYSVLGSRPGPGTDIIITPTNPISGYYNLRGATDCGKAFLERFYPLKAVTSGQPLRRFKEELTDWGLAFETDWSCVVSVKGDPL